MRPLLTASALVAVLSAAPALAQSGAGPGGSAASAAGVSHSATTDHTPTGSGRPSEPSGAVSGPKTEGGASSSMHSGHMPRSTGSMSGSMGGASTSAREAASPGMPMGEYPPCRTRTQDRCRVMGQQNR